MRRHRGAEHGDGRVVSGGVDEEVGDLVEASLLQADRVEIAAIRTERFWRVRSEAELQGTFICGVGLVKPSGAEQPSGDDESVLEALLGQSDLLGEGFQLCGDCFGARDVGLLVAGPDQGRSDAGLEHRVVDAVGDRDGSFDVGDELVAVVGRRLVVESDFEHVDEGGVVAALTGDVECFDRKVSTVRPFECGVVGGGERGEEPGAGRCRVGADAVERGLDHGFGRVVPDNFLPFGR